jgi:hypothetical protein
LRAIETKYPTGKVGGIVIGIMVDIFTTKNVTHVVLITRRPLKLAAVKTKVSQDGKKRFLTEYIF